MLEMGLGTALFGMTLVVALASVAIVYLIVLKETHTDDVQKLRWDNAELRTNLRGLESKLSTWITAQQVLEARIAKLEPPPSPEELRLEEERKARIAYARAGVPWPGYLDREIIEIGSDSVRR